MRLYFVRHAQSEANVQMVISNRGLPHRLTDVGRLQAEALAHSLADVPLAAMYSSPIVRAAETARIVAASRGLSFEFADALREPDCGIMEGRADEDAWAEHDRVTRDWAMHRRLDSRIEGGESFHDLRARFVPFIERLIAAHGESEHNILLITHGSLLYLMLPIVLVNIDFASVHEYPMPNAGIIMVERQAGSLVCLEWCGKSIGLGTGTKAP